MDKKIAGLLGAVATLGTFGTAEAAPPPAPADVLQANSYADLLEPIPNAGALLQAIDESAPQASENVQLAQFYYHHHHHHHHHHSFYRRRYYDDAPVVVVPRYRRYYHHHHHHHHHHSFYRRDYY